MDGGWNKKEPGTKAKARNTNQHYIITERSTNQLKEHDFITISRKEYRCLIEENTEALTTLDILTDFIIESKSDYLDIGPIKKILGIGRE